MSVSNAFDGLMTTEGGDDDDDDFGDFTGAPTTISPQSPPDDDDQAILPTEAASSATSAITPSSLINTATLPNFHPSPLEYAYAAFLLATYFSIPPPRVTLTSNGNSCTNDTKIELSGSSAAPILLTATNVPIPLIHACWNVVDPAGLGVLTHRAQFAVLLRLIALAQAHLVPATSGAFNPTEILLGALERTKQLTVTLPTFAALGSSDADGCGGGSVPSVAKLLELYPPPPPPTTQSLSSTSNITSNSSFGAGIEKTNSGEGIRTLSINDAFDSLIMTTTNADLSINENLDNADDEFGEFEGVEEGAANKVGEEVATEGVAVDDDDDDDFGNFVIAQPSPPIVNNTLDEYISNDDDDDDNFGNFETPPSLPPPPNYVNNGFGKFDNGNAPFAGVNGHVQTLSISDAFEGLVVVDDDVTTLDNHHVSLPMNNEIELNGNDNDNDDEFGDFEASEGIVGSTPPDDNDFGDFDEPTNETLMSANDTNYNLNNTLSISKAFHSVNVDEVVKSDHGMPSEKIQINFGDVENEDIENFDTIADDNEFGDFDTATHAEVTLGNVQTLSISDAFEGLIAEETVNDLPLPPLSVAEDVAHDDADDFGDFGDFETPAEIDGFGDFDCPTESSLPADTISSHVKTLSISDAFEELIANDTSTAQFDGSSVNEVDDDDDDNNVDAFEEFNEAEIDQPLQPMNADPDENDDFGDFEAPTHVEEFKGFDGPAQDALGHVKTLSISDAFEGLIHEEVTIDEQLQPMNADNTDEIDDFGDFEAPAETDDFDDIDGLAQDALSTLNVSGHLKTLSISDAFEELIANDTSTAQCGRSIVNVVDDDNIDASKDFNEAEIDVPLQPMNFDNIDEIDDFGDFEAPTEVEEFNGFDGPAQDVLGHVKTLSISDAFEGLSHEEVTIDQPLQPMNADNTGENDDFGDFETPTDVDELEGFDGPAQDTLSNQNVNTHVKTQSKLDEFEGYISEESETSPSAQFGSSSVDIVQDDENIDVGVDDKNDKFDTLDPQAQDKPVVNNHIKTLSISDAFEGLIHETAVIDCSLPPLSNVEAGIDDDDFGDFEAPAVGNNELVAGKVLDLPLPSLVIPSTINLSHQRMVSEITTAGGTWKDTAAISDSSAMMPVVSGNQNMVENNDMIDDDFGDFEGVEGDDSGADGGGIAGAGFTSPEHQVLSINENGDFGGFGVVEESSHVISVNDNEGFGDSAATYQNEATLHVNSHVKTVSVSDAFDELLSEGATSDYPLPPLMPMMIPTAEITSVVDDMNHPDDAAVDALEFRAPLGSGHDSVYSSSYVDEFGDFHFSGKAGESISGGDDKGDQLVQEVESVDISTKATPVEIVDAGDRKFEEEKKTNFDDGNYHNNQCGEENDNFGEFVDFPSHQENDNIVTATLTDEAPIQNDDGDESFGRFGDFSDSIAHNTIEELTTGHNTSTSAQEFINEEYDLFGDFGDANHDFSDTAKDDGFGQFDALPTLTDDAGGGASDLFVASSTTVQNDDDFGTLDRSDTIHHSNGGYRNEDNSNDDHDNFGDFSSVPNDTPRKISDKEFVLEDILGVEFGRLVGIWKDFVLRAVECDLQNGIETMDDLSNNLSSTDRTCIIKSRKFKDYIFGLAEFVRVVRCISATIGDLLCVDKNIELQETNLSQWKDNSITADAIVIEYLWSQLRSTGAALGMSTPELESVVEIRARGCFTVDSLNNEVSFCQLTLRPLEGGTGTQSRVVWNDKEYMACAANFCANRVPGQAFD